MSESEALAQLARLLGDDTLRNAGAPDAERAANERFDLLVDGLANEAASSDDVSDQASALAFVEARLRFFERVLPADLRARLIDALRAKVESW